MSEVEELIQALNRQEKLCAMLAPSFPIMYEYPQIVGKLKRLGFKFVVEVASGAQKTNEAVLKAIQENPNGRFITSPCPTIVRLIKNKFPHLLKYLSLADSPMVATARLVKQAYPEYRPVFIGPCIAKKYEATEDHIELNILVLTFKELEEVFKRLNFADEETDREASFDLDWSPTRLYPLSGGLVQSCGVGQVMAKDQIMEISGPEASIQALTDFEENKSVRLLDILSCEGGCIGGPGIESPLNLEQRRQKVIDFWEKAKKTSFFNS